MAYGRRYGEGVLTGNRGTGYEERTCHCGSPMRGSDHCPDCMCEENESWCDHVHVPEDTDED